MCVCVSAQQERAYRTIRELEAGGGRADGDDALNAQAGKQRQRRVGAPQPSVQVQQQPPQARIECRVRRAAAALQVERYMHRYRLWTQCRHE